jgi:hypothetical protein
LQLQHIAGFDFAAGFDAIAYRAGNHKADAAALDRFLSQAARFEESCSP